MTARICSVLAAALSLASACALADAPTVIPGLATHKTIYGEALADARGMTLYVSDDDAQGRSKCDAACAETWQPLAAARLAKPSGDWSVVTRDDGTRQWAFQGKPLYLYADDHAPGDSNGEGTQGRWHAAMAARAFLPPGVTIRPTEYGPSFTTADGRTLYMFVQFYYNAGANGTPRHQSSPPPSACAGDCTKTWIPLVAPAEAKADGDWAVVARPDGSRQWSWKEHPLYTYADDAKTGDALGEGHWTYTGNVGTHWEVANIVQ
jgi:predicted lipoprotein with Yx(FWY)xxD motif